MLPNPSFVWLAFFVGRTEAFTATPKRATKRTMDAKTEAAKKRYKKLYYLLRKVWSPGSRLYLPNFIFLFDEFQLINWLRQLVEIYILYFLVKTA